MTQTESLPGSIQRRTQSCQIKSRNSKTHAKPTSRIQIEEQKPVTKLYFHGLSQQSNRDSVPQETPSPLKERNEDPQRSQHGGQENPSKPLEQVELEHCQPTHYEPYKPDQHLSPTLSSMSPLNPNAEPFNPQMANLTVSTLNVRSIQKKPKRESILSTLTPINDVIVLTETWLKYQMLWEQPHLKILQSPSSAYHGVAIITKENIENLQPILPDLWTPEFVAGKMTKDSNVQNGSATNSLNSKTQKQADAFVIGVYWPPKRHREHLSRLQAAVNHCRALNPSTPIIITGDMNLPKTTIDKVAKKLNMFVAQQQDMLPTHKITAANKYSQTDYALVSTGKYFATCATGETWSDHNPLQTFWSIQTKNYTRRAQQYSHQLKKLTLQEQQLIYHHKQWPQKSYIQIARKLGLTNKIRSQKKLDAGLSFIQKKRLTDLAAINEKSEQILMDLHRLDPGKQAFLVEKTKHRLLTLWSQRLPRLFLKQVNQPFSLLKNRIMETIRTQHPKEFFVAMHKILHSKSKAEIAQAFQSEIVEEQVQSSISIADYIKKLYNHQHALTIDLFEGPMEQNMQITIAETTQALKALGNKATGVDELDAKVLKHKEHRKLLIPKLTMTFNNWLHRRRLPSYVTTGKLLNLSKDDTQYPKVGQIRTISMGCGLFKVFESVILNKLQKQIKKLGLVHHRQRGFQERKNTAQNIDELLQLVQQARQTQETYRRKKTPQKLRNKEYILFVDLQKAFDKVNRVKLLQLLEAKGVTQDITNALASLLNNTSLRVGEDMVNNTIGVPQGSRLSPILFVLYVNDLIKDLNTKLSTCLAFADDLVIYCKSHYTLSIVLNKIEKWSQTAEIAINKAKSAILQIRMDKRTPNAVTKSVMGIPVQSSYKYLGIELSDSLEYSLHRSKLKKVQSQYKKTAFMQKIQKLHPAINYHCWVTLVQPKINYGTFLLTPSSPTVRQQCESFLYTSYKTLLGIKCNPDKGRLLQTMHGAEMQTIFEEEESRIQSLIRGTNRSPQQSSSDYKARAKRIIIANAKHLVLALTGNLFGRTKKQQHMSQCHCGERITHQHLIDCRELEKHWHMEAVKAHLASGSSLKRILTQPTMATSEQWLHATAQATKALVQSIRTSTEQCSLQTESRALQERRDVTPPRDLPSQQEQQLIQSNINQVSEPPLGPPPQSEQLDTGRAVATNVQNGSANNGQKIRQAKAPERRTTVQTSLLDYFRAKE